MWLLIFISILISLLFKSIFFPKSIPPGPLTLPVIGNILWLRPSFSDTYTLLRRLKTKYGPILTLHVGPRPTIFISDRSLAHQALIQNGVVFSDRPPSGPTLRITNSNQQTITSSSGATWRLLRRNLTSEILNPSRIKSFSPSRRSVLGILIRRLVQDGNPSVAVCAVDHFRHAMFCLLVFMSFGEMVEETKIDEIETVHRRLLGIGRFYLLNVFPTLTKILMRKKWLELHELRKEQEDVLLPLIQEARRKVKEEGKDKTIVSYVDSLLDLELPEKKRKVEDGEIVSLISEFLNGGTDTTTTALQWIMANLVKYPKIQEKLFEEIKEIVKGNPDEIEEVKEEDLKSVPYLKSVILEGLRRHPPAYFVLPHAVKNDIVLDGYVVPKKGVVNVMVAEMGWDPKVWEEPMEFKPERFLNGGGEGEVFDVTGSREIKMMPFGAGRRICPAYGLAMLHLEYFVANLVWKFEWKAVEGDEIDLSWKQEFTMVMKNPLKAILIPRSNTTILS
ncbi:hypothetical protein UlMin_018903 [Ulmus minor]